MFQRGSFKGLITEDYNGLCLKCGYDRVLVRYGSWGYYQYHACPNCGDAESSGMTIEKPDGYYEEVEETPEQVWATIMTVEGSHFHDKLGFELSVKGIKEWVDSMPPSPNAWDESTKIKILEIYKTGGEEAVDKFLMEREHET